MLDIGKPPAEQALSPGEVRSRLRAAGFHPIPLRGKRPDMKKGWQWQTLGDASDVQIEMWGRSFPDATNTGILTKFSPAIDIDILHPEAAEAIQELVTEQFEERGHILTRIGQSPKRAILFRTDGASFKKINHPRIAPDGSEQKIELLANGQQLVVHGIHPDTSMPYVWHGGEPGEIAAQDLPYISEAEAQQLVDDAAKLLIKQFGFLEKTKPKTTGATETPQGSNWGYYLDNVIDHDVLLQHADALLAAGMKPGVVVNYLREQVERAPADDVERKKLRLSEIPSMVRSGAEKISADKEAEKPSRWRDPEPWWVAPQNIPKRNMLYRQHYIRGYVGATIGAGGRAKTTLGTYEAVSMAAGCEIASGEPLPSGLMRVWVINAEEDQNELDRRFAATCQHYGITQSDLGDRLFVQSVRDRPLRLATMVRGVPTLNQEVLTRMREFISHEHIDVFMLDPFISFHAVNESSNPDMDLVIKEGLGSMAQATNTAGEIFHHPGKPKPGQETSVEDGRGASAIIWAARDARVLNFMTPDEARKIGIGEDARRLHIRSLQRQGQHGAGRQRRLDQNRGRKSGQWGRCSVRHLVETAQPLRRRDFRGHQGGANGCAGWRMSGRRSVLEMVRIRHCALSQTQRPPRRRERPGRGRSA